MASLPSDDRPRFLAELEGPLEEKARALHLLAGGRPPISDDASPAQARLDRADWRDAMATARDARARARDRSAELYDVALGEDDAEAAVLNRARAAHDRYEAAHDREEAARERLRALVDREALARGTDERAVS
jgi:hypothetical protein